MLVFFENYRYCCDVTKLDTKIPCVTEEHIMIFGLNFVI